MRILLVEDEKTLGKGLVGILERDFYAVDWATDGTTAAELMHLNVYDLVILDWEIPPPTGIELLESWRGSGLETPVLMLTGRSNVEDRVSGLDTGADDYLTKPFQVPEFLARVRSLLRRRTKSLQVRLRVGDVEMDRATHQVTVAGEPVELSPKEFALLEYLLSRTDEVVTRTDLSEHVWDDSFDAMSNVIDVTVYRLRKKLDGDRKDRLLQTVKGVGYVLKSRRS